MQVNNNQPSFKAGKMTYAAERAMRMRMSSAKFDALKDAFEKHYKDSDFDVVLGTTAFESKRLYARISHNNKYKRYVEEKILASIFRSPGKFIERVNNIVENEVKPSLNRVY